MIKVRGFGPSSAEIFHNLFYPNVSDRARRLCSLQRDDTILTVIYRLAISVNNGHTSFIANKFRFVERGPNCYSLKMLQVKLDKFELLFPEFQFQLVPGNLFGNGRFTMQKFLRW